MIYTASAIRSTNEYGTTTHLVNIRKQVDSTAAVRAKKILTILVLDVSPSMDDNNTLEKLKIKLINDWVPSLPNDENINIVFITFAADAQILFEGNVGSNSNKVELINKIRNISSRSATNIQAGLELSNNVHARYASTHEVSRIVLTDGEPNTGEYCKINSYPPVYDIVNGARRRRMVWKDKDAVFNLGALTAALRTHVYLFTEASSADFAAAVIKSNENNTASFHKTAEDLGEQLVVEATKFAKGDRQLNVRIFDNDKRCNYIVRDSELAYDGLVTGRSFLVHDIGSSPLPFEQQTGEKNLAEFYISISCGGDPVTEFRPKLIVDTELSDFDKQKYKIDAAIQTAFNMQKQINNSIVDKTKEILSSDETIALSDIKVNEDDEWIQVTGGEINTFDECIKAISDMGVDDSAPVYRSLSAKQEELKRVYRSITPNVQLHSLTTKPIADDFVIFPTPGHEDILTTNKAAKHEVGETAYRSLGCDDDTVYTDEFHLKLESVQKQNVEIATRNNLMMKEWDETNAAAIVANKLILKEQEELGAYKSHVLAVLQYM
jgi:hypothetical protein